MRYIDSVQRSIIDKLRLQPTGIRPNYIYGLLYNWYAANDSRIANSGFGVPTDQIWTAMTNYVNTTYNIAPNNFGVGNHLKSRRQVSSPLGGEWNTSIHPRWDSNATHWGRDTLMLNLSGAGRRLAAGTFGGIGVIGYYRRFSIIVSLANTVSNSTNTVTSSGVNQNDGNSIRISRSATSSELLIPEGTVLKDYYKGNNDFLYDCVRINDRIWLAQNLAETKWSDGTDIPFAGTNGINYSNAEWAALTTPGVCAYNNDVNTWAYTLP
jgi:hypothetical protein